MTFLLSFAAGVLLSVYSNTTSPPADSLKSVVLGILRTSALLTAIILLISAQP